MERKSIPKSVRIQVWNEYIGEENGIGYCNVCGSEIKQTNYDCGHIISEFNKGATEPHNLRPICKSCNSSMGSKNWSIYDSLTA